MKRGCWMVLGHFSSTVMLDTYHASPAIPYSKPTSNCFHVGSSAMDHSVTAFALYLDHILTKFSHRPAPPTEQSLHYLSAEYNKEPGKKLESIKITNPTIKLSVIVPAYNEESRLRLGLSEALDWLEEERWSSIDKSKPIDDLKSSTIQSYEVIIVDDGSSDKTIQTALDLAHQHAQKTNFHPEAEIRVTSLGKNRGKGGAVRHGVLHARGEMILFVDADGATKFSDLSKLIGSLRKIQTKRPTKRGNKSKEGERTSQNSSDLNHEEGEVDGIAIGSRAHLVSSPTVVSRSKFRNCLMKAFHLYLVILGLKDIRDTQCGFKLMTRSTAIKVIDGLHVEGWIFDVEILLRAKLMRPSIPIVEVPIEWEEIQGSKLSILKDSVIMAIELFLIRINYFLGVWELD